MRVWSRRRRKGRDEPGAGGWGAWGPMDGACSSPSWVPGPTLAESEEGVREGRAACGGQGKADGCGVHVQGGTRQMGNDCSNTVGVWRVSDGPFSTVRQNLIPSDVQAPAILQ